MTPLGIALELLLSPAFFAGAGAAGAVVVLGARPLARRLAVSPVTAAAALASISVILLLTAPIVRPSALLQLREAWSTTRAIGWVTGGWTELRLLDLGVEGWANVVMYVPAAFLWSSMTGRRWTVGLSLVATSLVIESLQAGLLVRVAEPRDLYANTLGTAIGVCCAAMLAGMKTPGPRTGPLLHTRRGQVTVAALCLLGLLAVSSGTLLDTLADHEQDRLARSVHRAYAGTTSQDVLTAAATDSYISFASRAGTFADYLGEVHPDVLEGRFSTGSQARPRCVLVNWRDESPPTFRKAAGAECRVFRNAGVPVSAT